MKNFDKLLAAFPVFKLKNKKSVSKNIVLQNGEEVVVPANATVTIDSSELISIPSNLDFKLLSPTVADLISFGLIETEKSVKDNNSGNKPDNTPEKIDDKSFKK